ncbi:hypothetical protein ACJX0J_009354, partial [Zea mays]
DIISRRADGVQERKGPVQNVCRASLLSFIIFGIHLNNKNTQLEITILRAQYTHSTIYSIALIELFFKHNLENEIGHSTLQIQNGIKELMQLAVAARYISFLCFLFFFKKKYWLPWHIFQLHLVISQSARSTQRTNCYISLFQVFLAQPYLYSTDIFVKLVWLSTWRIAANLNGIEEIAFLAIIVQIFKENFVMGPGDLLSFLIILLNRDRLAPVATNLPSMDTVQILIGKVDLNLLGEDKQFTYTIQQ